MTENSYKNWYCLQCGRKNIDYYVKQYSNCSYSTSVTHWNCVCNETNLIDRQKCRKCGKYKPGTYCTYARCRKLRAKI